ncbi:hypothetical protein D0X99_17015 [Algoriphagus lacus]|uniref:Uncharacterized protein n=1 Tax=Algoriphagus lacus TaxID=2056311 RepID=A0A418PMZ8_9BACT|nr:DUF6266 family protein [Algoriphagus lacus]RIW13112.1 hypothetical protein D0X99_17015 [Algoriphagus lacus]
MAKSQNPLLSQLSGKLGNLVVYQLMGKTVIRRRPDPGKLYRPSKLQKFNQAAFRQIQQFLLPLKDLLDFGFGEYTEGMKKGIHLAMSWAMKHAVYGNEGVVMLQNTAFRISKGDLPLPQGVEILKLSPTWVRINWNSGGSLGSARVTDSTWVVLYHPKSKKYQEIREGSHRSNDSQEIHLQGIFKESGVLLFLAFYRKLGLQKIRFSDSLCFEIP